MEPKTTDSTNTGSGQLDAISSLLDIYGKLKGSKGSTQTTSTTTAADPAAVKAALDTILSGNAGVASVASSGKSAGLYNSSTVKKQMQDLVTMAAAKAGGTGTTTTQTVQGSGSKGMWKEVPGMMLLGQLAGSKFGKKVTGDTGAAAGTDSPGLVVSGADAVYNWLFGNAGTATPAMLETANASADPIGSLITSIDAASSSGIIDTAVGTVTDWWNNLFGAADGGRLSSIYGGKSSGSVDPEALVKILGEFSRAANTGSSGVQSDTASVSSDSTSVDGTPSARTSAYGPLDQITWNIARALNLDVEDVASLVATTARGAVTTAAGMTPGLGQIAATIGANPYTAGAAQLAGGKAQSSIIGSVLDALGVSKSGITSGAQGFGREGYGFEDFYTARSKDETLEDAIAQELGLGPNPGITASQLFSQNVNVADLAQAQRSQPTPDSSVSGWDDTTGSWDSDYSPGNPSDFSLSTAPDDDTSGWEGPSTEDSLSGFAKGGRIKGDSRKGVDDVLALLGNTPIKLDGGEFVLKSKSVELIDQMFGPGFLDQLNNMAGAR